MPKITTEAHIALAVMQDLVLDGWECYPEVAVGKLLGTVVQGKFKVKPKKKGPICDIVAVKGDDVMIVECKKSFSLDLIEQALEWTALAPMVAIGLPNSTLKKRSVLKMHLREEFGIGICGVGDGLTKWPYKPQVNEDNRRYTQMLKAILKPEMKLSVAGASKTWRSTPYQDTMSEVRCYLRMVGSVPISQVFDYLHADGGDTTRHHYSTRTSMMASIKKNIMTGVEADLALDGTHNNSVLTWTPNKCRFGERYLNYIEEMAAIRSGAEILEDFDQPSLMSM